ncbi:cellulose biosynthesis regulator diguanylate cyclase DgcQ [Mixta intestinalis]|uniref:diguanylate cyclase n=1 Tax=Mixta intestinalis TaxID=1615494 RepID=A0A6P1PY33_9GAMM|nr:cellulose biosynthesis regulator diguanylate cyclase DgcQ [Mixta intestinalis]QHM71500.1 putative diguanylate cyclase YedQ [Mixta intestinalis]
MLINSLFRRLRSERHPHAIVHLCFILVLFFSTFLTWREVLVLKETYETERQIKLSAVADRLERQFQFSLDSLLFYRRMLQYALANPRDTNDSRYAIRLFNELRLQPSWSLNVNTQRNMPLNGVSDLWLRSLALLDRSNGYRLQNELRAALEFSFILQFTEPEKDFEQRLWYLSRAGFFISSVPPVDSQQILSSYYTMIHRAYFTDMMPERNPTRRLRWTASYPDSLNGGVVVTVSVPVDDDNYWYGVLAMDFASDKIYTYLRQAIPVGGQDTVLLLDRARKPLAASGSIPLRDAEALFDAAEREQLRQQMAQGSRGQLRIGSRFVSWTRMHNFDGLLLSVQSLKEGIQGETGRVTLVLLIIWLFFTLMLLLAWLTVERLVDKLLKLQRNLYQRASYDPLTQLLNRGTFFEQANPLCALCELHQQPLALIQLDIDHFKQVNDTWGHHIGDRALQHTATVILSQLRASDLCGRIGGEEFCIVLPETDGQEASKVAERIRSTLAAAKLEIDEKHSLLITASFGVVSSQEQGSWDIEKLQPVADRRLYMAKQRGRNQICWLD